MSTIRVYIGRSSAKLRRLADEELMGLVCHNEAAAFEVVFERHVDAAFSLAHRMIGRRSLAEDIAHEAFLSIWRDGARYDRTRGSVRNWILALTHHRAVDALVRHGLHTPKSAGDHDLEQSFGAPERPEIEAAHSDEALEVRTALEQLPAEQVRVIELAYFGGFTDTEIAAMLDLPIGTVQDRMRLGLEQMRSRLGPPEAVL
jgi:RNA polymerase sigma-70 factor (ECF subfamily)